MLGVPPPRLLDGSTPACKHSQLAYVYGKLVMDRDKLVWTEYKTVANTKKSKHTIPR